MNLQMLILHLNRPLSTSKFTTKTLGRALCLYNPFHGSQTQKKNLIPINTSFSVSTSNIHPREVFREVAPASHRLLSSLSCSAIWQTGCSLPLRSSPCKDGGGEEGRERERERERRSYMWTIGRSYTLRGLIHRVSAFWPHRIYTEAPTCDSSRAAWSLHSKEHQSRPPPRCFGRMPGPSTWSGSGRLPSYQSWEAEI